MKRRLFPMFGYVSSTILSILVFCTIIIVILNFIHINDYTDLLLCFSINTIFFPMFIIKIVEYELSIITFISGAFILTLLVLYGILAFIGYKQIKKTTNGIVIALTIFDLLFSFPIIISNPLIGTVNILVKIVLVYCCAKNIKWCNYGY